MKSSRIQLDDKQTGRKKLFNRSDDPCIGGNNFFTGDYTGGGGTIGMNISNQQDWESFWRTHCNCPPPGRLPRGAKALMMGESFKDDPTELIPESVTRTNKGIEVSWQRVHMGSPGDAEPKKPQFAVLLVPNKGMDSQTYRDVFRSDEQRKAAQQVEDEMKMFTEGTREPMRVMPITILKRRLDFSKF